MNTYDLSRNWFDWCFEHPEKVSPNHSAIYFFAIEHCNRLGWKPKFGFPTQMAMDAIGIKKHQTYIRYFNELVDWGFFELVEKSKNQYSANIISIRTAVPKNGKALGKAIIKHTAKQTETYGQSNGQSNSSINKQETIEPINLNSGLLNFAYYDELSVSEDWINRVAMNSDKKFKPFQVRQFLSKFYFDCDNRGDKKNNKAEFQSHFVRWLNNQENTSTVKPTKQPLL